MANSNNPPLLALPSGSLLQFALMTLPLLSVYLYFLYLAIDRPNKADPENNPDYLNDRIRLTDILYCFLITMVLFASLAVYLLWFVDKRRKLSKRYETEAIVILGNVEYDDYSTDNQSCCGPLLRCLRNGCRRNDYGYVTYNLEKVSSHPACDYYEKNPKGSKWFKKKASAGQIRKKVRVYYRYPREQVSILVLPNYPHSGLPKTDLEADWASFSEQTGLPEEDGELSSSDNNAQRGEESLPQTLSRDRSLGVLIIATLWISFCFFSALYVCMQIDVIEEYYQDENAGWAWLVFWVFSGGVMPVVAGGGNYVRWKRYEWWILKSGKLVKGSLSDMGGGYENEEGGSYVQMS